MTQPSLERIIEQLQFCIVDAKALQLKMLERILSIALLKAYEIKGKPGNGEPWANRRISAHQTSG